MSDSVTCYYLAGIRVPHALYRHLGRLVPYRLRDVRTRPVYSPAA